MHKSTILFNLQFNKKRIHYTEISKIELRTSPYFIFQEPEIIFNAYVLNIIKVFQKVLKRYK